MRNARTSSCRGVSSWHPPGPGAPQDQAPSPERDTPELSPPCSRHLPPLWTELLTHTSENITSPQTSFERR